MNVGVGISLRSTLIAWGLLACSPAIGQVERFSADVTLGAGAASNPLLQEGDSSGSAFLELAINPRYLLADELGTTSLDVYYRRTQYLNEYGDTQAYGGSVQSQRRLSQQLLLRALLSFDSSILGERGSALIIPIDPVDPVGPGTPLPPNIDPDLGLFGLGQRSNRIRAGLGAEYQRTEVDIIAGDVEIAQTSFGDEQILSDFRSYSGTLGYARSLSERTRVGARVSAQIIDYDLSGSTSSVVQPQLTLDTQLDPLWSLKAAAGLLFVNTEQDGRSSDSIGFSANVTGCRKAERSALCLQFQRDAAPSGLGEVLTRTSGSVDYSYRLGERSNLRAHADISRVEGSDFADRDSLTYGNASAAYDRELTKRLSGGVSVAYRDIYGLERNVSADVSGQLFVRARLGSVQ
jgi:hypothetical protein